MQRGKVDSREALSYYDAENGPCAKNSKYTSIEMVIKDDRTGICYLLREEASKS